MKYEKGKLYDVSIADFQADPNQPRKVFDPDAMAELADSIKKHGILQPILFRQEIGVYDPNSPGSGIELLDCSKPTPDILYIVAGERRLEAAKKAGLTRIPAIAVEGNTYEIALVENLLRQDLTAVEEAEALGRLMVEQKYNQEQLAGIIGKARQTITDILTLNRLPQDIRDECRGDRKISRATLIGIARKKQVRGMETAYKKYQEKSAKKYEGRTERIAAAETAAKVLLWLNRTNSKLSLIDTSAWSSDEKNAFLELMNAIRETILTTMNPIPAEVAAAIPGDADNSYQSYAKHI